MERGSATRSVQIEGRGSYLGILGVLVATIIAVVVIAIVILYVNTRNQEGAETIIREGSECLTNFDCGAGQVCEPEGKTCVQCYENGNCTGNAPICNTETFTCQGCLGDSDCPSNRPTCDEEEKICIACTTAADCAFPQPFCEQVTRTCVECAGNSDCPSFTPFCSGNFTCAECISDANCLTGICTAGICCDITSPTISTVQAILTPPGSGLVVSPTPRFLITYTFAQSLSTLNGVILYISDNSENLIITTPVQPVTGSLTYVTSTSLPKLYYNFIYRFQIQFVTDCGPTEVSPVRVGSYPLPTFPPQSPSLPPPIIFPVITGGFVGFGGGGVINSVTLFVAGARDSGFGCSGFFSPLVFYSTTPNFEPNLGAIDFGNSFECVVAPGDNSACEGSSTCRISITPSFFIPTGQTFYFRVAKNPSSLGSAAVPIYYVTPPFAIAT